MISMTTLNIFLALCESMNLICSIIAPERFNYYQVDADGDGIGDFYFDPSLGVVLGCDNCYDVPNSDQLDSDYDGVGMLC